ncbi:MAG: cobalamin biosynthesis protein CbiM [Spirochaetes bacterium RBG_16_49_21]|nr:MAG: cobalamin biosynthesis protein CbiM [Spirochaetes bacterium RBG_16_49_21]
MHISEGILTAPWAGLWFIAAVPFLYWGIREIKKRSAVAPQFKTYIALMGAAVFIISCMPIPVPVAGTCSHPCGTGLAAILVGPAPTAVLASIALTLQALFLAHGGVTTLGANIFSMGVVGAFSGYAVYVVARRVGVNALVAAFLAGLVSDWMTYASTSFILSSALHGEGSLWRMFLTIVVAFVPTQVPLGILEGILSMGAVRFIYTRIPEIIKGGAR